MLRPLSVGTIACAVVGLVGAFPENLFAQASAPSREPLPLDVALALRGHNSRSPINFSPNGEWIAHTVQSAENVPRDSTAFSYSPTGFPFAEGDARMEATLTNVRTGEAILLGGSRSASWAPVWSPDGNRVAFYSDEGGEAGLWIWERATRTATRFPGVIVRPYLGFEGVRWSVDGRRLIVKILPAGMTIAEANAKDGARRSATRRFPQVAPGQPSVIVRRFDPAQAPAASAAPTPGAAAPLIAETDWLAVDLAIMDVRTKQVTRVVERAAVRWYAWSPDERFLAYTVLKGREANSQQPNFDLNVFELATGAPRTLSTNIRLGYGIEWSWSPDGRTIGYIASGQLASGEMVLVSLSDGSARRLRGNGMPSFDPDDGEFAPLWSADGTQLFAIGNGALWRIDARSGQGSALGATPDWQFRAVVTPFGRPTIWSGDGGRTAWVTARRSVGSGAGLLAVDLTTGRSRAALREAKSYSSIFSLTASETTGELAIVSTDQQRLDDIWVFDTRHDRVRQATRNNPALERYELGTARLIAWTGIDGQPLRGTLLLPPGYVKGRRVPLVVSVYGGAQGSAYVNSFGGRGGVNPMFNMHVLATRGYAVLYPDAPLREGRSMSDLLPAVMGGVDAAIDSGYADPNRLAVTGQSFGSLNTLALITQTARFKAAIITGVVLHPDLFADYLNNTGYYEHGQGNMGGSIWDRRERYFDNSPLFLFDRIQTPLLIGQGDRDGNLVPPNAVFAALERLGKPVEFRLYESESHVISQKPNVRDFWLRRLEFLAKHLNVALDSLGGVLFDAERAKTPQ
ncbi:MAG: S9 family peptidase [Gemmatimonadales bacterium]|nr:S9 family peptidase [Gemmatimonadales bacterium]